MTRNRTRSRAIAAFAGLGALALLGAALAAATPPAGAAGANGASLAPLVERVLPAVVSIEVEMDAEAAGAARPGGPPPALRRFFRERGIPAPRAPHHQRKGGSGFFIDGEGRIVTNWHIVRGAARIQVRAEDGSVLDARLAGHDPETDLALLETDPAAPVPHVEFADSDAVRIGDPVIAIGSPFGFAGSVTSGIVSARGRDIGASPFDDFLQVDAAINRGNSGGPAFDLEGRVIGVNTAIFSPSGGSAGVGFAVPSNTVRHVVADLMDDGRIERGWLGIHIQPVDEDIALALGLDGPGGALVAAVIPGGPAERAGLRTGDVIVAVDGRRTEGPRAAARAIAAAGPEAGIPLTVWRDGGEEEIPAVLGVRPRAETAEAPSEPAPLGLALGDDGSPGAVVAGIEPGSEAERKDVRVGDRILAVDGEDVSDAAEASERLQQARDASRPAVLLRIEREGDTRFLALKLRSA